MATKKKTLDERLNDIKSQAKSKDEEAEPLPDIREVIDNNVVRTRLSLLMEQSAAYQMEESRIKKERAPISTAIKETLEAQGYNGKVRFGCGDVYLNQSLGVRRSLSVQKLMEAGVDIETINNCYEDTPYVTLTVAYNKQTKAGLES